LTSLNIVMYIVPFGRVENINSSCYVVDAQLKNLGMIPAVGLLLVRLATFGSGPSAWTQSSNAPQQTSIDRSDEAAPPAASASLLNDFEKPLRMDVDLVLVPVTVSDARNRPVIGLKKQHFALYQDNEKQEIRYFSTEDAPVSVGLLLDVSKSMSSKFDAERVAVSEFFKNANAHDDYFVVTFSDHPKLVTGSTQSIDTIQSNLAAEKPDGNTALFDAIYDGVARMRSAQYRRRAILIISDGGDNHSRHHLREIKRQVQDSDVEVFAIGLFDTGPFKTLEEALGKRWLSEITDATGGRTIAVDSVSRLPDAATTISREMRDQYILGYRPNGVVGHGTRKKIQVQLTLPPGSSALHAYYKTGYVPTEDGFVPAK
jgi:Ca-activated chloride channel family protein